MKRTRATDRAIRTIIGALLNSDLSSRELLEIARQLIEGQLSIKLGFALRELLVNLEGPEMPPRGDYMPDNAREAYELI